MTDILKIRLLITIVFLLYISTPAWSMALTTFGKSNPQNQNQPTPPPTPGELRIYSAIRIIILWNIEEAVRYLKENLKININKLLLMDCLSVIT